MDNREVLVRVKAQYGQDRIFPANPTAVLFSRLIDQKTFTQRDLQLIEQLGYTIRQAEPEPLKFVTQI